MMACSGWERKALLWCALPCDLVFVDEVITGMVLCLCVSVSLLNAASTVAANLHLSRLVGRWADSTLHV